MIEFKVIKYDLERHPQPWTGHVEHGANIEGEKIVAVIGGNGSLCHPHNGGPCGWCNELRKICNYERVY